MRRLFGARSSLAGRTAGPDTVETLRCLNNLASALAFQGNFEEAELHYRQVLSTYTRTLGASHPDTLAAARALKQLQEDARRIAFLVAKEPGAEPVAAAAPSSAVVRPGAGGAP